MQKTYWWRVLISFISGGFILIGLVYDQYFCFTSKRLSCPLDIIRTSIIEPVVMFSLSVFFVSFFLFFINDAIFKKWLRLAAIWCLLSIVLISLTPEYQGGWMPLSPDRELVSIWMSSLLVIISIPFIAYEKWKEWKSNNQ